VVEAFMTTTPTPVLRTDRLCRSFGAVEAVRDVSLHLEAGQVYGFLGRNGAGKTTTLRMLIGVLRPDRGRIELMGESSDRVRPAQRRRLGYVSQEQVFYPWMTATDLGEFVGGFYPTWDRAEYARLLSVLDIPPDRKARLLSGGTRAKLGLALALAHRPPLLIMDEPTAGLDPVARREFQDLLSVQVRREGQAVLLSSHLVNEVEQICDRIGIIEEGRLLYQGGLHEMRRSHARISWSPEMLLPPGTVVIRAEPVVDGRQTLVVRLPGEVQTHGFFDALTLEEIFLAYARHGGAELAQRQPPLPGPPA
jgi:ABC-2 type transport system ATP-binding protein